MATDIYFLLDASGSMARAYQETLSGFNEWLTEIQKVKGKKLLTLVTFDTEYKVIYGGIDVNDVPELTEKEYVLGGMTALYDTLGYLTTEVMAKKKVRKGNKVMLQILTDGKENASKEYDKDGIKAILEAHPEWVVTYMSASPDAFTDAEKIGIAQGNTARYSMAPQMRNATFTTMAASTGMVLVGEVGPENVYAAVGDSLLTPEDKAGTLNTSGTVTANPPLWTGKPYKTDVQSINLKEAIDSVKAKRGK